MLYDVGFFAMPFDFELTDGIDFVNGSLLAALSIC